MPNAKMPNPRFQRVNFESVLGSILNVFKVSIGDTGKEMPSNIYYDMSKILITCSRGCVTPRLIENINESLEEHNNAGNYDALDGYDELSPENQEKVRKALEQGHVDDSEWNGVGLVMPLS